MIALLAATAAVASLGMAEGQCRVNEPGPAVVVTPAGLKDRAGKLRLELYPDNDNDFLEADAVLVREGKTFRRVEVPIPVTGPADLCIRAPRPGTYALSLVHERSGTRKFHLSSDGVGFPNDPKLGFSRPKAAAARLPVGDGVTHIVIRMNYRRGLFAFGPLGE